MASPINKKVLKHLAELARIELTAREEERLAKDLQKILDYFKELQELDSSGVELTSHAEQSRDLRADDTSEGTNRGAGVESFPDVHEGFLKVPAIFERNDEP